MDDRASIEDEDFDYRGPADDQDDYGFEGSQRSQPVQNQPHDEEVALSDTGSFAGGAPDSPPNAGMGGGGGGGQYDTSLIESNDEDDMGGPPQRSSSPPQYEQQQAKPGRMAKMEAAPEASDDGGGAALMGYNAAEFKHLNVSDDIRELFKLIGRYQAHSIDLDTQLKPFVPDYIPSVGSIDEFIKVPRPDAKPDFLGLKVLDEPASRQSDPTVLTLQLRNLSKEATGNKTDMVGRIDHLDDGKAKKVQGWIQSISDIHKSKPAPNVTYSRRMPDIEDLMQEWPPEMETFLRNMKMPSGELDLDLKTYTKMLCGILDIPVHDNPIESLHVLFSLYLEFKSNPIFKQQLDMDRAGNAGMVGGGEEVSPRGMSQAPKWQGGGAEANVMTF